MFGQIPTPRPRHIDDDIGPKCVVDICRMIMCDDTPGSVRITNQLFRLSLIQHGRTILTGYPQRIDDHTLRVFNVAVVPNGTSLEPVLVY